MELSHERVEMVAFNIKSSSPSMPGAAPPTNPQPAHAAAMIQVDGVGIIAIFTESVLYGVSLVMYVIALAILLRKRGKPGVNKPMLVAIIMMWLLGTLHLCADLIRLMIAFLSAPGGPKAYLTSISTNIYFVRSFAYVLQTLTGDGFILYRLYLVWNGDRRVSIPMLLVFLVNVVVGGGVLHEVAVAQPGVPIFTAKRWVASLFALTLFSNAVCSGLIAWRIWSIHRRTAALATMGITDRSLVTAATIIIESGATYSIFLIIQLSLYVSDTFAQYILIDMTTQLVGIVFSLVIVRVGLGITIEAAGGNQNQRSLLPGFASRQTPRGQDTFSMDPVEVHISKVVTRDDGSPMLPITFSDRHLDRKSRKSDVTDTKTSTHAFGDAENTHDGSA